jgi:hypothetical protein
MIFAGRENYGRQHLTDRRQRLADFRARLADLREFHGSD